jgi:hypothetical protein
MTGLPIAKTLIYSKIAVLASWYCKFFCESTPPLKFGKNSLLQHNPSNLSFGSYCSGFCWFLATLETHCWCNERFDPNDESITTQNIHS